MSAAATAAPALGTSSSSLPAPSLPPPLPSSVVGQLSRLELESAVLADQFRTMVSSLAHSHSTLAELTIEYMRSMSASVRSSAAAVDILVDTHTSLIRKMLIAVQQTSSIDTLERQVAHTKTALTEMERGVEHMLAEDALQAARAQLQQELDPRMPEPAADSDDDQDEVATTPPRHARDTRATTLPDGSSSRQTLPPPKFDPDPIGEPIAATATALATVAIVSAPSPAEMPAVEPL
jgi:hypothetical protein